MLKTKILKSKFLSTVLKSPEHFKQLENEF